MNKILLAIGDSGFSQILRNRLSEAGFNVIENEVLHRDYLEEIVSNEIPDILIIHDYYLASSRESSEGKEKELLDFFQKIRMEHDDRIRIVFLCEREREDAFLAELVSRNVLDIFHNKSINTQELVDQLRDKPRFSRVSKFLPNRKDNKQDQPNPNEVTPAEELFELANQRNQAEDDDYEEEDVVAAPNEKQKKEKPQKVVVKQVVEKKIEKTIVNKVVNKQVVKRDYNIQILNQVEKVVGIPIQAKTILVGSPFSRSGSTFFSHLLARELSKLDVSVTYIESPYSSSYSYDRFNGHNRIPEYRSKFYQFTKEIDPKVPSVFDWELEGVNMIVRHPNNEPVYGMKEIPFDVYVKILLASQSTVTILDVGTDWHQEIYRDLYDIATNTYFVIEPDISNIQFLEDPDNELTSSFRKMLEDDKTRLIGNRFDSKVLSNEMIHDLYADKLQTYLPCFSPSDIFGCHYNGTFFNDSSKNQKEINEVLLPIMEELLPNNLLKKRGKNSGLFKGLFNKKVKVEKIGG
ncbi:MULTISPECIES: hypothetical protein [Metabacillus]|uniref:hypothetical protein n=1 Tax=Metabacillus TaxID=2675233 RepID=UPI000C80E706|nr:MULTISPECIES: hypothetical protein [Metabacillus]MCM3443579.1 hypothetical protein [Metabacillus halosaccharovorans]PMC34260.1 hypothetical protein CJ195_24395 [Bacillus sp. UMB0899]